MVNKENPVVLYSILALVTFVLFSFSSCNSSNPFENEDSDPDTPNNTANKEKPIETPEFHKTFSGSTALVLDTFELPRGLYKILVNTNGFFQLFDVESNTTIFNLGSDGAINAETVLKSNGGNYTFRTDNISAVWTLTFKNIDFSNPSSISNINNITASVPKVLGPYDLEIATYKVTMKTNGFFQLFPITSITGEEEGYIFNAFSGNYGAQNTFEPTVEIMLFRTANISESYSIEFIKL